MKILIFLLSLLLASPCFAGGFSAGGGVAASGGIVGGGAAAAPTTSYFNTGGTGDRTAIITATCVAVHMICHNTFSQMIDGVTDSGTFYVSDNGGCSGDGNDYLSFDFGSGHSVLITEAKFYQQTATSHATFKWQGSADNSNWTDIGNTFTWGVTATQTQTELGGNTTSYRYYRALCVSGAMNGGPYMYEMEFKIAGY
jgi:hypothetical protein